MNDYVKNIGIACLIVICWPLLCFGQNQSLHSNHPLFDRIEQLMALDDHQQIADSLNIWIKDHNATFKHRKKTAAEQLNYAILRSIQYAIQGNEKAALGCLKKAKAILSQNPQFTIDQKFEYLSAAIISHNYLKNPGIATQYLNEYFQLVDYIPYEKSFKQLDPSNRLLTFLNLDYIVNKNLGDLNKGLQNRQAVLNYFNYLHQINPAQGVLPYSNRNFQSAFEDALVIANQLKTQYRKPAFEDEVLSIFEQSKGIKQKSHFNISKNIGPLFEKERNIQSQITKVKRSLVNASEDSLKRRLKDSLILLENNQKKFLTHSAKQHPNHFQLNNDLSTIPLKPVQYFLDQSNAVLLEFLIGEKFVHVLKVSQNETKQFLLNNKNEIEEIATSLKTVLLDHRNNEWEKLSKQLYTHLLDPVLNAVSKDEITRIYISTDGILGAIPFEILMNNEGKMLIDYYTIDYISSMTMLDQKMEMTKSQTVQNMAAFVPQYKSSLVKIEEGNNEYLDMLVRSGNYELKGALDEAKEIAALVKGKLLEGEQANLASFISNAPKYDILHLAIHGYSDIEAPMRSGLIFSDPNLGEQMMDLHELRDLKLNAKLVVLSACETGFGKYEKSDGINTIAESFTYSGVPSVVMSLWKAPEIQTKQIMVSFYKFLLKGYPKDEALQHAKKDYLKSVTNPEHAHPYYWAGFVIMGDPTPLAICTWGWHRPFAYGVLALLGIIVVVVMFWRHYQDWRSHKKLGKF